MGAQMTRHAVLIAFKLALMTLTRPQQVTLIILSLCMPVFDWEPCMTGPMLNLSLGPFSIDNGIHHKLDCGQPEDVAVHPGNFFTDAIATSVVL